MISKDEFIKLEKDIEDIKQRKAELKQNGFKYEIENGVIMIRAKKSDETKIKKLMKGYCKSYGIRFNDRVREEM